MSKTDGHGIVGLLDHILSNTHAATLPPTRADSRPNTHRPAPDAARKPTAATRRGRPLGRTATPRSLKEKVTLRITASLVARYRDWSWEARSQLSQLVERALLDYHDRERIDGISAHRSPGTDSSP